jgi:hypothetical protein
VKHNRVAARKITRMKFAPNFGEFSFAWGKGCPVNPA